MLSRASQFLKYDLWRIRARNLPKTKSAYIRPLRIWVLSFREFGSDNCALRASALTFFSLLSIVPTFAMAFGIAQGFGLEQILERRLLERLRGHEEVASRIIEFSHSLLQETRGGVIAGIGVVFLVWAVMRMFGNIEKAFNTIWGVQESRSLGQKFTAYLSLMVIGPVVVVLSGSLNVFITTQVHGVTEAVWFFGYFTEIFLFFLGFLPLVIIWGLLAFLYVFMPNTRVNMSSAFIGAIISGTLIQLLQWAYINFQIGAGRFGAIYGSFAALPLFLIWLQLSWLIVLYGAEVAFAHQNEETYEFEAESMQASNALKKTLAVQITHACVKAFIEGRPPVTIQEICRAFEIPSRLTQEIFHDLIHSRILAEVRRLDSREAGYLPARPVEDLSVYAVISALDDKGLKEVPMVEGKEMKGIRERFKSFDEALRRSPDNSLVKDLAA